MDPNQQRDRISQTQTPIDQELLTNLEAGVYEPYIPRNASAQPAGNYFTPANQITVPGPVPTIIIPYAYQGAPIPPVPQDYPSWTVNSEGVKKPCWILLQDRLARGHAGTLSEEFNAYASGMDDRVQICLAERGTLMNNPYADIWGTVQDSDFPIGSNVL